MSKWVANPVEVDAFEIENVHGCVEKPDDVVIFLRDGDSPIMVVHLTAKMISRHFPRVGDYYVIQADDYRYLNPKEVFERKYRPRNVDPPAIASPSTP